MSLRSVLLVSLTLLVSSGCALMQPQQEAAPTPETHNILFDVDKSQLRPEAKAYLNGLAEFLKANPNYDVVLEGHTDNTAANDYNLALAERRAKAVQGYLAQRGVNLSRTMVVSYGEARPVAPNQTAEGKQENRRVSVTTIERETIKPMARVKPGVPKYDYNGTDPKIPGRENATLRATHH
ncbi:MAG: OmpA family protein [Salinisphaeraceae bacterium]|nr:OmpA family protein [Salinisphaeraceae bacterium]